MDFTKPPGEPAAQSRRTNTRDGQEGHRLPVVKTARRYREPVRWTPHRRDCKEATRQHPVDGPRLSWTRAAFSGQAGRSRVQPPTGPLPFFITQLTSTIGQSAVRCQQVAAPCRFVAAHIDPGFPRGHRRPHAEPDADEIRLLGG